LATGLITLLLVAIFGRIMSFGLSRDEMLYVTPAALLSDMSLYTDMFYNHAPYSAWLFRTFHLLSGEGYLLFSARLAVFVGWLLLTVAMIWLVWSISRSWPLAVACLVAFLTNDVLLSGAGLYGSNNFLPMPFVLLGLGLFVRGVLDENPHPVTMASAGICLSIAVGIKISAIAFIPPVALGAFLLPWNMPFGRRFAQVVLPLAVGGLIGALPMIVLFISDPAVLLAHLVGFHTGPHVAYWDANQASEPGLAISLKGKVVLAVAAWFSGSSLLLVFLGVFFGVLAYSDRLPSTAKIDPSIGPTVVILGALVLSAGMSFIPTPGFPQYYVPPLICLPLLCALLYRKLNPTGHHGVAAAMSTALIIMLVLGAPRLGQGLAALGALPSSTVFKTDNAGATLRGLLAERGLEDEKVATLMPIYPVEADLPVYPEFATGQFAYRIVPFTEPDLLAHYRAVGPDQIEDFLTKDPPGSLLLGFEPELERPFLQFALSHGYSRISDIGIADRYGTGVLFVRPE
jgi:hypothetical protein